MQNHARRILVALAVGAGLCLAALAAALFLSRGTGAEAAPFAPPRKIEAQSPAETSGTQSGAETTRSSPARSRRPTVTVRESAYGPILFDRRGFALYAFTRDPRRRSVCADDCAAAWPPYLLRGSLRAAGTRRSLLGVTRRGDGGMQVTYGGRPLYYYVGDREPGQVLCQNVVEFGGTWLVLRASGRLVR
jgi:predicted lipoprotein with Yx(FWY)xxD motif